MISPARREITGRKVAATAGTVTPDTTESETDDEATDGDKQEADADKPKRKKPTVTVVAEAFSIPQFCTAHGFSRAFYYILKQRGLGPDETRLLGRVIITKENAARWRKRRSRRDRAPEAARAWRRQRADTSPAT
jgi:hypothetical protein